MLTASGILLLQLESYSAAASMGSGGGRKSLQVWVLQYLIVQPIAL